MTFNDDIQGTAAVATGALLSAINVTGVPLTEQRVAVLGAGSAGCGIASLIRAAMVDAGLPESEAAKRFFMFGELPRGLRIIGPAFRDADRAGSERDGGPTAEAVGLPPAFDVVRGNPELRHRPFRRAGGAVRQRQDRVLVDEARLPLFAPSHRVDEAEPHLAKEADPFRDARQRRRESGLPGPRQHQRGGVVPAAKLGREGLLLGQRQPAARQVEHDPGANIGHIIDQRGAKPGCQKVDRPVRPALAEHPDHGVAAHEIADPNIGHDEDRSGILGVLCFDIRY